MGKQKGGVDEPGSASETVLTRKTVTETKTMRVARQKKKKHGAIEA